MAGIVKNTASRILCDCQYANAQYPACSGDPKSALPPLGPDYPVALSQSISPLSPKNLIYRVCQGGSSLLKSPILTLLRLIREGDIGFL